MCKNFSATMNVLLVTLLLAFGTEYSAHTAQAQQTQPAPASPPKPPPTPLQNIPATQNKVVIETKLVNLTVTVTDHFGRFVTGLEKENFAVFDDKIQQDLAFFSTDDAPISLGIVYDVSSSMRSFTSGQVAQLRRFFENSHPEDEFCVIAFNNRAQLVHDFTSLPADIINRAVFIPAKGSTALFDATYLAIEKVRQGRHHKKVVLIFSDGEENSSRYSGREVRNLIRESDVQVYAFGVAGMSGEGAPTLRFLTEPTGGEVYFPFGPFATDLTFERLALILRRQYTLGYYPNNLTRGSQWHNVQLTLKAHKQLGKLKVSYKNGYWVTR